MTDVVDYISEKKSCRNDIIKKLIESRRPCIVWGAGKFALHTAEALEDNNIEIVAFVDREEYYFPGKSIALNGRNVPCILNDELVGSNEEYNIVSGSISYEEFGAFKSMLKSNFNIVEYVDFAKKRTITKKFLEDNRSAINNIYESLADEKSKKVFGAYLEGRLTGNPEKLIAERLNKDYLYDWELIGLKKDDVVLDAGAYYGDTVEEIIRYLGGKGCKEIICIEPDTSSCRKLKDMTSTLNCDISVFECGLFRQTKKMRFSDGGNLGSSLIDEGIKEIQVFSLDEFVSNKDAYDISIIKMDIEGAEYDALMGGEMFIKKYLPKMAVCIYHTNYDIINIYNFFDSINKTIGTEQYRLYLRQHSDSLEETVLYAIPYSKQ